MSHALLGLVFLQIVDEDQNEKDDNVVLLTEEDLAPARKIVWDNEDYIGHPYQVRHHFLLRLCLLLSLTPTCYKFDINFTPLRLTARAQAPEGMACDRTEFKPYSEVVKL